MSQRHGHKRGMSTYCPACGSDMHFRKLPRRGNTVTCQQCQSLLRVTRLAPLTLEWAFEEPIGDDDYADYAQKTGRNQRDLEDFDLVPAGGDDEWEADWDEEWGDEEHPD